MTSLRWPSCETRLFSMLDRYSSLLNQVSQMAVKSSSESALHITTKTDMMYLRHTTLHTYEESLAQAMLSNLLQRPTPTHAPNEFATCHLQPSIKVYLDANVYNQNQSENKDFSKRLILQYNHLLNFTVF